MNPGEYLGLPMADYLGIKAVNSSLLGNLLDRCPAAAWYESAFNPAFVPDVDPLSDVGSIAHAILLEGNASCCAVIDPLDHPAEKTGAIPEGWTNKSIRAARAAARAEGLIPVLAPMFAQIEGMVAAGQRFIEACRDSEPAIWRAFQPEGGQSELTIVWDETGTLCKMRPDRISADRRLIVDAKFTTTNAAPDIFGTSQFIRMGYWRGAAFYARGLQRADYVLDPAQVSYVYLVIEQSPPHLCSLIGVNPQFMAMGAQRMDYALAVWRECVECGSFPGYPPRVAYPDTPPWLLAQWESQQAEELDT